MAGSGADAKSTGEVDFGAIKDCLVPLREWGVVRIEGRDASKLLQNLLTNDVADLEKHGQGYAAFLNQKGRYLFDGIVSCRRTADGHSYLIQTYRSSLPGLLDHLKHFTLRMKAVTTDLSSQLGVWSVLSRRADVLEETVRNNSVSRCQLFSCDEL